ncbi:sodium:proton antiporter [Brachybacterium sp. AOP43-C2-M15]|uniref:sodium:proton antiporter n=1 Tax=Brachybacterium sp. AOP43-C2-M15 TaxID=3457661 RepID=UPI00403345E0
MMLALSIGLLIGGATFLMLQRDRFRVVLGFVLLSHGVNLLLFATGGTERRGEPLGGDLDPSTTADALPQAFVLTAIVISFAITIYLLILAVTGRSDPPEDDHGAFRPVDHDGGARSGEHPLDESANPYEAAGTDAGHSDAGRPDAGHPEAGHSQEEAR